ncbi:MAG: Gfo/Idh/MocA family protein [Bacillota bacterium]
MRNLALVGYGYWGPKIARAAAGLPEWRLAAICDYSPERLAAAGRAHPDAECLPDVSALWSRPEIDAVVIATPTQTHYALAQAALLAGKHALVEKPLVQSHGEALALFDLARATGRILRTGHTYLHDPAVLRVREILRLGWLGELRYIHSARRNLGLVRRDTNVIWDLGPHDASILTAWLDSPPTRVAASGWGWLSGNQAEVAHLRFAYAENLVATVDLSWVAPEKERRITLVGTKGMLVWDDLRTPRLTLHAKRVEVDPRTGAVAVADDGGTAVALPQVEPLRAQLERFGRAIDQAGASGSDPSGLDLTVVQMLVAAQASLEQGGEPVAVGESPSTLWTAPADGLDRPDTKLTRRGRAHSWR